MALREGVRLVAAFQKQFPQVQLARSEQEVLEDPAIQLVLSSIIPEERRPLGIRVMQHGKDYWADKPGITTRAADRRPKTWDPWTERFQNDDALLARPQRAPYQIT